MKKFVCFILTALLGIMIVQITPVRAQEEYSPGRWDKFAKKVRFTYPQERQLKILLQKEKNQILQSRAKAAQQILKILNEAQERKWDQLYRRADKKTGYVAELKKRMLLNPAYLESKFTLKPEQKKFLFYIAWDHARRVNKIRKKYRTKISEILMKEQMENWDRAIHTRLEIEAKRQEKLKMERASSENKDTE